MPDRQPPPEIAEILNGLRVGLSSPVGDGSLGQIKCAVYAFYDYDGEPIYVGQTRESVNTRIGRHLTGQRSDAVAKSVLDPHEVAEVEVWPFPHLAERATDDQKATLNAAEYKVFKQLVEESRFDAILNEQEPLPTDDIQLPRSHRFQIVPDEVYGRRRHPDARIARRASTIANLARIISERDRVSSGLRRTLRTQARRLERLASDRLADFE